MRTSLSWLPFVGFFLLAPDTLLAQAQADAEVEAAIKAGQAGKSSQLLSQCVPLMSRYRVNLGTNLGRIATLAEEAKKNYMPYARGDVPDDLLKPAVYVWADPAGPTRVGNTIMVPPALKHLVLKSKARDDAVVQPEEIEITPVEWPTAAGGKFEGTKGLAVFPIEAVRALPPGDFDVVLITEAGERRCKLGDGDRRKLKLTGAAAPSEAGR